MKQNRSFLIIGITGGAGSGKTTVVECVKRLEETVFLHCDVIAHGLMEPGQPSYRALVAEYGPHILDSETGKINREKLAKTAFETEEKAKRLNAITHPLVREQVEHELLELQEKGFSGVVVIEAALLIEAGYEELCDELWYVHAPVEERVRRMKENRGYSDEKIGKLLAAQLDEEAFMKHADFVIQNPDMDGILQEVHLLPQIASRLKEKLESAGKM